MSSRYSISLGVVATRRLNRWREIIFLVVPVIFYLIVAMTVGMNIGVRHILVVYVFLYVLIGGAIWALIQKSRKWTYAVRLAVGPRCFICVRVSKLYRVWKRALGRTVANS